MIFILKGKTNKGKQRIKRDGDRFVCVRELSDGRVDLEPVNNPKNWRLVHRENDPDFEIVEVLDE